MKGSDTPKLALTMVYRYDRTFANLVTVEDTVAKSVPINLPNGRNWAKKGEAVEHFRDMLARYSDGDRVVSATDHDDLAALLKIYDAVVPAGEPTKTGSGVAHFERRLDRDHPGHTSCFFVVRTDGSSIDFSTRRALDVAGARDR